MPRTLQEEITSKKEKRDAKKEAKHLKTDHLSNDQHTGGQQSNGETNRNQSSFGNFNGNRGSIPTKGFIKAMPTNASLAYPASVYLALTSSFKTVPAPMDKSADTITLPLS